MVPSKKDDDIDSLLSSDPTSETSSSARVLEANAQFSGQPSQPQTPAPSTGGSDSWNQSLEALRQSIVAENQQMGWSPEQQPPQAPPGPQSQAPPPVPGVSPELPGTPAQQPAASQSFGPGPAAQPPAPGTAPGTQQPPVSPPQQGMPELPPPPGTPSRPLHTQTPTSTTFSHTQPSHAGGEASLSDIMEELRILRERQELILEKLNVIEERVRRTF